MVKKFTVMIVLLVICQAAFSQKNVNQLFKEFSKAENVTTVNVGNITMKMAGMFTETMGVDGVEIFSFDECSQEVKNNFANALKELKDPSFETMVNSSDDNKRTKILVKIEDETIHELIVATTGSNSALLRIKGKIKPEDIERVVNKHSNGQ